MAYLGRDQSYEDEINQLTADQSLSVEELRAMYGDMNFDLKKNTVMDANNEDVQSTGKVR